MSKYTTQLRFICEMKSGFTEEEIPQKSVDDIISHSREKIFDFQYPIYEAGHQNVLETKILKHYYFREIGAETYGQWHTWLNDKMNLIMPKYNKLYEMEYLTLQKELRNVDIETWSERTDDLTRESDFTRTDNLHTADDHTRTDNLHTADDHTRTDNLHEADTHTRTDNLAEGTSKSATSADKYSDTPQGTVTNVNNDSYLTDYRQIVSSETGTRTNNGTQQNAGTVDNTGTQRNAGTVDNTGTQRTAGTSDHTGTQRNAGSETNTGTQEMEGYERGYRGSKTYMELMTDYADKILNIDMMIVNECSDLFMLLW